MCEFCSGVRGSSCVVCGSGEVVVGEGETVTCVTLSALGRSTAEAEACREMVERLVIDVAYAMKQVRNGIDGVSMRVKQDCMIRALDGLERAAGRLSEVSTV